MEMKHGEIKILSLNVSGLGNSVKGYNYDWIKKGEDTDKHPTGDPFIMNTTRGKEMVLTISTIAHIASQEKEQQQY